MEEKYRNSIKVLMDEFGIDNKMAVPKIVKVVVNSGIGAVSKNKELVDAIVKDMSLITGQKPSIRKARVSVSAFDLRKGQPVGVKVTLRKKER